MFHISANACAIHYPLRFTLQSQTSTFQFFLTSRSNSQTSWPVTRHSQISLARFQPK